MLRFNWACFLFVFLLAISQIARADVCGDIWPGATTGNSTESPELPTFTGSSPLVLDATLAAGDHHYSGSNLSGGDLITNNATTRIYFNGNLTLTGSVDFNVGGNPENLIVIVNGDLNTAGQTDINGLIYVTGDVSLSGQTDVVGSVTAGGSLSTSGGAGVIYDPDAVDDADFGGLCSLSAPSLKIVSPVCGEDDKVIVTFNSSSGESPLDEATAENTANYTVVSESGATHTVTSAILSDEGYEVQLTVTPSFSNGTDYTVTVSNVEDTSGTSIATSNDQFYFSTTENGLPASYWGNPNLSGNPSFQQVDSDVDFSWGVFTWPAGGWTTGFSIRWEGYIEPDITGTYQFQTVSRDGSRVWFDDVSGNIIIDRWSFGSGTATSGNIDLEAGVRYPVKAEFYKDSEAFSSKEMRLQWQTPAGGGFSSVPNSNLYTCVSSFISDDGLVAHYTLDGPGWDGTTDEVIDSSFNGLHGTSIVSSGSTYPSAVPAQVCNGAEMNGTNFIRVPDNPLLDLTDQLAITAWIRMDAFGSSLKSIFSKDENYEFHINNSGQIFWWWQVDPPFGGNITRSFNSGGSTITLGNWHHIAIVYSSSRQSIYLDGVEVAFRTYSNEILVTNNDPMEIGADQGLTDRNWVGIIDEVKLYDRALTASEVVDDMNATHPCAENLDRFEVTAASTASVCLPTDVTIRAVQSDGTTYTSYTGTMDVSTSSSHGNWSVTTGGGTLNPNPDSDDDGAVQYTFDAADSGVVVLSLENTHADVLTVTATENGGTATGTSSTITFSENAFVITPYDSPTNDFIAGRDHELEIEVLRLDPSTGSCGRFLEYDGDVSLKAWAEPTGAFSVAPSVNAPALRDNNSDVTLPDTEPAANNITLSFTEGLATTHWVTSDVSQRNFNLLDDSSGFIVDENGDPLDIVIEGGAPQFTVRPFGFYLLAEDSGGNSNPQATDETGNGFVAAGEDFAVNISAVAYGGAGQDGDNDGIPDSGVDLSGNSVTSSYGSEVVTAENDVVLTSPTLQAPSGGTHLALTGNLTATNFTNGVASTTVRYEEVGIINLEANLNSGDYLGTGSNVEGTIDYVGRFYPAEFLVTDNSPQLSDANWVCDFTYQGQPFGFVTEPEVTITAVNTFGATTVNYTGAFWSLPLPQHTIDLDISDANHPPTPSECRNDVAACFSEDSATVSRQLNESNGVGVFTTLDNHQLTIEKQNAQPDSGDVPWNPSIDYTLPVDQLTVSETNGYEVCYGGNGSCAAYNIDVGELIPGTPDTEIRYGRAWLDNTTGSVITPLIMNVRLQYWDASGVFVSNTADNDSGGCSGTLITTSDIQLSDFTGNLASGETGVGGLTPQHGYYLMSLDAAGYDGSNQPNDGSALVTWLLDDDTSDNNPGEECTARWLCYDYDGDGLNENPSGRAIFSTLPDGRPLLFQRESYR